MLVDEVMSTTPVSVRRDATVHSALRALAEHRVTSMAVVDGSGRVCGVVSEADVIKERVLPDPRAHELPPAEAPDPPAYVEDVMTPMAVTVEPRTELSVAIELMTSTAVKSLPVVDREQRLVGMVSRSDVVRLLARPDTAVRAEIGAILASIGHGDWLVEVRDGVAVVEGPAGAHEVALARTVAGAVPGVVRTRVEEG